MTKGTPPVPEPGLHVASPGGVARRGRGEPAIEGAQVGERLNGRSLLRPERLDLQHARLGVVQRLLPTEPARLVGAPSGQQRADRQQDGCRLYHSDAADE